MALAMLVARRFGDGEATTVWALHKAEVTILEGQQFSSQRCRSWRFAADIYIRQSKQLHIYWAMGVTRQSHHLHSIVCAATHSEDSW